MATNVIGPDVSFYQDDNATPQHIDFVKLASVAPFVICRAGQNTWPDPDFKANWYDAKLVNLPRGSYWFYDSRADPKRQAEIWISMLDRDLGELPLFADFEEKYKGKWAGWKNWYSFIERIKALAPGKEIAIYTGYYYWIENTTLAGITSQSMEYFHQFPLWIANYNDEPIIPRPWTKDEWLFWQFTDNGDGSVYGVESKNIDLNYFNGDIDQFRARFNLTGSTSPPARMSISAVFGDKAIEYKEK